MDTPGDPDLTVKLFGNTIALSDSTGAAAEVSTKLADDIRSNPGTKCIPNKILNVKSSSFCSKDTSLNGTQSVNNQNEKMETDSKPEEVKTESDGSDQENELNKPNNILPCPRCNSMDTKLCYFNNQNVNQPRHLCRSCSRYWTVGGTVRNVPIGAARRTYKRSNHRRHAMMSCDGNVSDGDASDAIHQQSPPIEPHVLQRTVRENENVTRSGSGVPFWSKVPVFSTKEKDYSSGCSGNWIPENTVTKEQNNVLGNHSGLKETHPHIQSYRAGPASVVPWSPGWNNVNDMASTQCSIEYVHGLENGTTSKVSLPLPIMMSAPGLSAPVVPSPLMPPLWSCIPDWPNGMWSSPWPASNGSALSSPPPHSITCSGNNSPKLGKHSREETLQGGEKKGNNICVPKVLRITDPKDVAKSSFLASLGIKPDDKCICKSFQSEVPEGCKTPESPQAQQANQAVVSFPLVAPLGNEPDDKSIFKSFQSEVPEGCKTPASPQAQQANPAAASRSQSFQERM